jgi:hypothetical protein
MPRPTAWASLLRNYFVSEIGRTDWLVNRPDLRKMEAAGVQLRHQAHCVITDRQADDDLEMRTQAALLTPCACASTTPSFVTRKRW